MAIIGAFSSTRYRMHATSIGQTNASLKSSNQWAVQGDFLRTTSIKPKNYDQVGYERLVKGVKHALRKGQDDSSNLVLIDAIQRMGIEYHFQDEIDSILQREYDLHHARFPEYQTPFEVSLWFRLLRQQGYNVPADVFSKFKNNNDATFISNLSKDIKGLIGLYEAAQLGVPGEDILDNVSSFSREHLNNACLKHNNNAQARIIRDILKNPCHRSLASYKAKSFIANFKGIDGWGRTTLQELANMDFSITQKIHQHELSQVSRWWRSLGLTKDLKLLRDQPIKWYAWPMAVLTDPTLSEQRVELAKCISFVYVLDDIFDVYGSVHDLTLFTEAVHRWESEATVELPEYMRSPYKALYDTINAIGYNIFKRNGQDPTKTLQMMWKSLCDAFLDEAKWFASGVLPTTDEYLKNGLVSSGVPAIAVHMFYLLGLGKNNESSAHMDDISTITSSTAMILRLSDDLGSAKDENQDGNDGSYVNCYMNEYRNTSLELAGAHVVNLIEDEWKQLNKEHLRLSPSLRSFTNAMLNSARMVPLMYNYDDKQSLPILHEYITSMLYSDVSTPIKC